MIRESLCSQNAKVSRIFPFVWNIFNT